MHQQHRPLASFSTMFRDYTPPNPKPVAALAKPVVDATTGEKQKIKIIIVAKKLLHLQQQQRMLRLRQ